jgi:F0F1-type ATP synthase membrane subunit c/vacuolar-type H+-ATPase subunit K
MPHPPEFDKAFATSRFLGLTFAVCLMFYLLLEEIVRARFRPFLGFAPGIDVVRLRYFGFAAAVALVIALRIVHSRILAAAAARADGPRAVRSLFRAGVISLALAETPALIGLVLFLLAGLNTDFYLLLFVSIVLVFMYFPRKAAWETVLEKRRPVCPL